MRNLLNTRIKVAVVGAGLAAGLALLSVSEAGATTMQANGHAGTSSSSNSSSSNGQLGSSNNIWNRWRTDQLSWARSPSKSAQFTTASWNVNWNGGHSWGNYSRWHNGKGRGWNYSGWNNDNHGWNHWGGQNQA